MAISPAGILTVDTKYPIANTNLAISMTDGYQIYVSPIFKIEVIEVKNEIYAYLAENITKE